MVDKSASPLQTHFGSAFRDEAVQRDPPFPEPGSIRVFLRAPSPISPRDDASSTSDFHASQAGTDGKGQESTSRAVHRWVVLSAAITGVCAFGEYPLRCPSPAFHLTPRAHWCKGSSHSRGASGGETTGGAVKWSAWPEKTVDQRASAPCGFVGRLKREPVKMPKQHQRGEKEAHEQKQENVESHTDPRRLK